MGKETGILWTDHTMNAWWGCTKVSPECDGCYAEIWDARCGGDNWGKDAPRRFFGDKHWNQIRAWDRQAQADGVRRRVFWNSMSDLYEDRADLVIHRNRAIAAIAECGHLDHLLLTKRPQNYNRFTPGPWPEHVWIGTTVGVNASTWRIDAIRDVEASVHWLSIEPLLEDLTNFAELIDGIDWVVVGGESGPKARPMQSDWVRRIRDVCIEQGVAFFFKQWGEWLPPVQDGAPGLHQILNASNTHERVGKKAAGRLLDGQEWSQMPEVARAH